MPTSILRYRAFLRRADTVPLLAMALVARMPVGMMSLALLLHLRDVTASFTTAGALVGTYLVAAAVAAPIIGRRVDLHGPRRILVLTGILQPSALALVLCARPLGLPAGALAALLIVAGGFAPPISVLTRTVWRHRFDSDRARRLAFAIDGVLIELNFTLGPALVALAMALSGPATALALTVAFAVTASPLFLLSPALRLWRQDPQQHERHLLGPLTCRPLLRVYAVTVLVSVTLGLLEAGYPGFATAAGMPAMGGILIAVNSAGSAVGGLTYGVRSFSLPVGRQLTWMLALLALPVALHATAGSLPILAVLAFMAGLLVAPTLTAVSIMVARDAPPRYATEAFTWSSTSIVAGIGGGMAAGGRLLDTHGPWAVFALAAACALAGAALSLRPVHRTSEEAG